jgi:LemA protein
MEADSVEEQVDISNQLDTALRSIIVTFEAYPYLQSIQAVTNLMISLEGMEARIATERGRYNDAVKEFNTKVRKFPTMIIAGMFDFDEREYFESDVAPENP